MLNEYYNEIIAVIAVLTLSIMYILSKKGTKPNNKEADVSEIKEKTTEIKKSEEDEKINEPQNIHYDDLSGSQEGNFGEEQETKDKDKTKKSFHKRTLIQHGKITKQNFSEFSGNRILIAEDNLINQKVITGLLAGSGINITIANDGKEVLNILENDTDFLLILMDAHMPRIDGFEATRIIRNDRQYNHIPIIALSGDTALDDIKKMTEVGMDEHLEKPLRIDALYDIFYAYSGNDDANDYVEIIMTKELNGDKGLEICGGDEHFYREILNEFINDYKNSYQTLNKLLNENKLKEADKLLLDILGITANIGAIQLNSIAHDIKFALNDTHEKSYLSLVDQYKVHLDALVEDIKEYM